MTILDKLLEKKDVSAYIDFRIASLKNELSKTLDVTPDKDKQLIKERFNGRILELEVLKDAIQHGKIKEKSKMYSKNIDETMRKENKKTYTLKYPKYIH